jgi:BlaI family transcriptional regulator, penicillinase repressor
MQITAAESQVMDALWRRGPLTFDEVLAEVTATQPWGRATVKTLVNRLLNKKAILSERQSGRHQYRALVERADYVDVESQGLLDRLFEGELTPLISHFAEYRKLKPEEIERLKRLIEEIEGDS